MTAREFKGEMGARVGRVTEEPPKEPRKPHYLCNKVNEKGTDSVRDVPRKEAKV